MKRIITVFFISLLSFTILQAQNRESRLTIEEIISKVAEAMGGLDKINNIETLRISSLYPDHGDTPIIIELGLPNMSRNPKVNLVFDGTHACFLNGRKESTEPEFINEEELKDFNIEIALHFPAFFVYPTELINSDTINEADTFHLQTTLPGDVKIDYYIDKKSYLPQKANAKFILYEKEYEWGREYRNYKTVGGILFPHEFTYPGRDKSLLTASVVEIEINTISKNVFTIPDDVLKMKLSF